MQTQRRVFASWLLAAALLAGVATAGAQEVYKLRFKGVCNRLDANGDIITERISNKTLIREWASRAGATNFQDLELVFRRNADETGGDSINVIDKRTGAFVAAAFPLAYPEAAVAATPKRLIERRFDYVFNIYQPQIPRGTVIMDERILLKKDGSTRSVLTGRMQWYQLPTSTDPLRICNGKFNVRGKPLVFP